MSFLPSYFEPFLAPCSFSFLYSSSATRLNADKALIPQLREVIAQFRDSLRIQIVNSPRTLAAVAHEARVFQYAQMLRHRRARNGQSCREFIDRVGMLGEQGEDRQTRRIAQSCPARFVRKYSLTVSYYLPMNPSRVLLYFLGHASSVWIPWGPASGAEKREWYSAFRVRSRDRQSPD